MYKLNVDKKLKYLGKSNLKDVSRRRWWIKKKAMNDFL